MPVYEYQALDAKGAMLAGHTEAPDRQTVVDRLHQQGRLPMDVREVERPVPASGKAFPGLWRRRAAPREITEFFRELALLSGAGYPLDSAVGLVAQNSANPRFSGVLTAMKERIRTGESLSSALEGHPQVFSRLDIGMVRAGEATGRLDVILARVAEYRDVAEQLRETVAGALAYPAIVVAAAALAVILLLTFVVPQFEQLFADAHATLPLATRIVVAVGHTLRDDGWMFAIALLALLLGARQALTRPAVRQRVDGLLLRLPVIGNVIRAAIAARFFQTLGMLLKNGLDLPAALRLARESALNLAVAAAIDRTIQGLREGRPMAEQLAREGVLPALAVGILRIGEESGNMTGAALHIAEYYSRKMQTTVKRLLTLLEPILILLVGTFVGGIIYSIIIAVINLNELAR